MDFYMSTYSLLVPFYPFDAIKRTKNQIHGFRVDNPIGIFPISHMTND